MSDNIPKNNINEVIQTRSSSGSDVTISQDDVQKDIAEDHLKEETRLDAMIEHSQLELYKTSSIFPLDLFHDELAIELNKVDLSSHFLFLPTRTRSAFVKEIKKVTINRGLIFSTIEIIIDGAEDNPLIIHRLPKKEARKATNILEGLIIAAKQGLDMTKLKTGAAISDKLETLGSAKKDNEP
ncbi:MAG TPA: hypothetical protein VF828_02770 [Patescibacteria group bacterium]